MRKTFKITQKKKLFLLKASESLTSTIRQLTANWISCNEMNLTFSLRSDWFRDDRARPGGLVPLQAEEQRVGGPEPGGERRGVRLRVRHRHRRHRAGPGARRRVSVLREQRRGRQPPPQTAVTHLARVLRERLGDSGPQRVGGERGGGGERHGGGPNRRL